MGNRIEHRGGGSRRTAAAAAFILAVAHLLSAVPTAGALTGTAEADLSWLPGGGRAFGFEEFLFTTDTTVDSISATYNGASGTWTRSTSDWDSFVPGERIWSLDPRATQIDQPFSISITLQPGSRSATFDFPHGQFVNFDPASPGQVVGWSASTGATTVRILGFDGMYTTTVTPASDGSFTADLGPEGFARAWASGDTVTVSTSMADNGITLRVGGRNGAPLIVRSSRNGDLASADVRVGTQDDSFPVSFTGHPAKLGRDQAVFSGVDLTGATATRRVAHQGVDFPVPNFPLGATAWNEAGQDLTGVAPPGSMVNISLYDEAGFGAFGTVTASPGGTFVFDALTDGGAGAPLGSEVTARVSVYQQGFDTTDYFNTAGYDFALAVEPTVHTFPQSDTLQIDFGPIPGYSGRTWTVEADASGPSLHTLMATTEDLQRGVNGADFSPPVDLANALDMTVSGGGDTFNFVTSTVDFTITDPAGGIVHGTAAPGADVYLLVTGDISTAAFVTADMSGDWSENLGVDLRPDTVGLHVEASTTAFSAADHAHRFDPFPFVHDEQPVGAAGGTFRGFVDRIGATFDSGGPADFSVRFLRNEAEFWTGWLPESAAPAVSQPFGLQFLTGATVTRVPPVTTDLFVPIDWARSVTAAEASSLVIGYESGAGWEVVPPARTTLCVNGESLPASCPHGFELPFAFVEDLPHASTFAAFVENPASLEVDEDRAGGKDRIETAVLMSQDGWASADTVVVARSDDFPDALAATPLAAASGAPLLLNPRDQLDPRVAAEIQRLGVTEVLLMGGSAAQAPEVATSLDGLPGVNVQRIQGANRFETAAEAAAEAVMRWGPAATAGEVVIALGSSPRPGGAWPDALAAGPLTAAGTRPLLLVTPDSVPAATAEALNDLSVTHATVAGGTAAISESTAAALGVDMTRVGGASRYETALLLAHEAIAAGATDREVVVATGRSFPDALAAGPMAALRNGVLVLTDGKASALQEPALTWFEDRRAVVRFLRIAGGVAAIGQPVADEIVTAIS